MGRANRKYVPHSGWRERFISRSQELSPEFEGHEAIADRAAEFYNLPEREQEKIIARVIKNGYENNPEHGDKFPISDNGKIYGEVIHNEGNARDSVVICEDRFPESDEQIAEATSPPFLENHVAKTVREKMLEAADYISKDPGEESLFELVGSRKEWERRRDEGTLHPDGKITAISISEEEYQRVLEDKERVERGLPPIHSSPPKRGQTPPWAR